MGAIRRLEPRSLRSFHVKDHRSESIRSFDQEYHEFKQVTVLYLEHMSGGERLHMTRYVAQMM